MGGVGGGVINMQTSRGYRQCARCGSPALRGESLCFWHHPGGRERYRAKQIALKPNFNKLAIFEMFNDLPKRPLSPEERKLFEYALQITLSVNCDEERNQDPSTRVSRADENARVPSLAQDDSQQTRHVSGHDFSRAVRISDK